MKGISQLGLVVLVFALIITGCAPAKASSESTEAEQPKFVFVVTEQLGDKSFNDSAAEGTKRIESELGFPAQVMEVGFDQTKWEPAILDLSESGEYQAIFLHGPTTQEIVAQIAPQFPEQKYVLFDTMMDLSDHPNIFGISYKQNEASYLGGVVAALVSTSDMPNANSDKAIGFIGGDEGPVISDFLVGYIEGAKSVVPDIKVHVSYVGSWVDTARAKELALAQFNQGVDVIFPAAMTAGLGVIEAAAEEQKYIIGVDSDQASILSESDPEKAEVILTSVIKKVGESLFHYAQSVGEQSDQYATTQVYGIKENSTGIVDNEYYQKNVPAEIREQVEAAREAILEGKVEVSTALGVDQKVVDQIIESVQP